MDEFDALEFTAIASGLGLKEPKPVPLESFPPFSLFPFLWDQLFVLSLFLICGVILSFLISLTMHDWFTWAFSQKKVFVYGLSLFLSWELFYFLFFKQFKVETLGTFFEKN